MRQILTDVCIVAIVLISFLAFAPITANSENLTKVTVAEGMQPPAAPLYVAAEKGFWKEEGLDVDLKSFTMGRLCLDAVLGGRADAGYMAETPPILAAFRNQPIRLITAFESSRRNTKLLVRKGSITHPTDLKGKKVACSIGTNGEYFMSAYLKDKGIDRSTLNIINLSPADMVTAIAQGGVEAIFTWEPHITNAKTLLGDKGEIWFAEDIYREGFFLGVTESYAQKNPKVVTALLKGLIKAEKFIKENPEEAIQITAKKVNMQPEVLKSTWEYYDFMISLEKSHLDTLISEGRWAVDAGIAPPGSAMPDFMKILYPLPLKEIDPARVDL